MLNFLRPDQAENSIYDIDLSRLSDMGFRHFIIDIDNTITAWNRHQVDARLAGWVLSARDMGFSICLLSNNTQLKVQKFASELGVTAAPKGGKPFLKAFNSALTTLQGTKDDTIVIGDQIFTDILGGNLAGLYTILVDPIDKNEFLGTRITRIFERLIARRRR